MCEFPKRKSNVQFWDFPKIAVCWENLEEFWSNLAKSTKVCHNLQQCHIVKKSAKHSASFDVKIEIRERFCTMSRYSFAFRHDFL